MKMGYNSKVFTDSDTLDFLCANTGDFPWHTSLAIKYQKNDLTPYPSYHAGVILNEKWVIASAYAIAGAASIRIDVGSVNISDPLVSVYPDAYILHSNYSKNKFKNNIALLRLSGENILDFTTKESKGKFLPIHLPRKDQIKKHFLLFESTAIMSAYKFVKPSEFFFNKDFWIFIYLGPFKNH